MEMRLRASNALMFDPLMARSDKLIKFRTGMLYQSSHSLKLPSKFISVLTLIDSNCPHLYCVVEVLEFLIISE